MEGKRSRKLTKEQARSSPTWAAGSERSQSGSVSLAGLEETASPAAGKRPGRTSRERSGAQEGLGRGRSSGPLHLSKRLAHALRGAGAAGTQGGGGDFASVPSAPAPRPWANAPGGKCPRPFPPRRGRTDRAHGPEARSPGWERESPGQGGSQPPGWLISPSRPWGWHPRPYLRGEEVARARARGREAVRVQARSAGWSSAESPGSSGSASSSPGQLDWLLVWDLPHHPLPQFAVLASRPFCRPFRFPGFFVFCISLSRVITNGFGVMMILEAVYGARREAPGSVL